MESVNDELYDYEDDSMNKVVKQDADTPEELQQQFDDFMDQSFKKRRNADDVSISLTGMTNQQRYEKQMKDLVTETGTIEVNPNAINMAKQWSAESNITMVYPCNNIDELYYKYMHQNKELRRRADWKCTEIFGVDCVNLYNIYKSGNIETVDCDGLDDIKPDDIYESGLRLVDMDKHNVDNHHKMRMANAIYNAITESKYEWEFNYSPYFHPKEIFELEGMFSDEVDNHANEVFKEYANYVYGYKNDFNICDWDSTVRKYTYQLENAKDEDTKNLYRQSLIKIGWNPYVLYTPLNIAKSKARLESMINQDYKNVEMLDCTHQCNSFNETTYVQEAMASGKYPISIVLVRGNSAFSKLIVNYTGGDYSHSALCLDTNFEKLYSFNASHYSNDRGGFSLESVSTYPQDNMLAVFTFFVTKEQYENISRNVQTMLMYMGDSRYSYLNVFTLPFKMLDVERDEKMICSQFVDKTLKLADIDLTKVPSSKVTPKYLYDVSIKNSRIYKVYEGKVKDFDNIKVSKYIESLSHKKKTINENATILYELAVNRYTYSVLSESKAKIRSNEDGDLIIDKKTDFDAEYYASHKLLVQYEKTNNIEGMKYELAKLYYMNYILEKRIYGKLGINKKKNVTTRAKILNDFNKYIQIVLDAEPNFNFSKYYEQSPYYANTISIDNKSVHGFKKLLTTIL